MTTQDLRVSRVNALTPAIAQRLDWSAHRKISRRANPEQLGVESRTQAVVRAVQLGLMLL